MKLLFIPAVALAVILCAGVGCSTSTAQRLNQLDLGMSQAQVKKILGDNYIAKASRQWRPFAAMGIHRQKDRRGVPRLLQGRTARAVGHARQT
jgi:hypothetical protein